MFAATTCLTASRKISAPRAARQGDRDCCGAYRAAVERVLVPAVDAYSPELILVSSGFDAAYLDPLARMMLSSEDFR